MHVKPNAVLLGEGSTVVATGIIFYATFVSTSMFKLDDAARRVFVRIRGWHETPNKQKLHMIIIWRMMVTSPGMIKSYHIQMIWGFFGVCICRTNFNAFLLTIGISPFNKALNKFLVGYLLLMARRLTHSPRHFHPFSRWLFASAWGAWPDRLLYLLPLLYSNVPPAPVEFCTDEITPREGTGGTKRRLKWLLPRKIVGF